MSPTPDPRPSDPSTSVSDASTSEVLDDRAAAAERAARFRELHERSEPFVVPNPWDVGSARLLAAAGFEALATTSAGAAASAGVADGELDTDAVIAHVATIVGATDLPVSADLEHGGGESPDMVAATIHRAAGAGASGGSIEDLGDDGAILPLALSVERIVAAVEAARSAAGDFVITARCELMLRPERDLDTTIARLRAYEDAGADVLYAPGLTTREEVRAVVDSVARPLNVVMGLGSSSLTFADLAELGVRRISVGSALARAAYGALLRAAVEITGAGTFTFADDAISYADLNAMLARR